MVNAVLWFGRGAQQVAVKTIGSGELLLPLTARDHGYFMVTADLILPGTRYFYRLDDVRDRPDPASRFQPDGVHQPSAVVDPDFPWDDGDWHGVSLPQYVIYELHVGTFSAAGTFDGVAAYLDELTELGITAVELMPVAQFPGDRNWGYDGVHPFARSDSSDGPIGARTGPTLSCRTEKMERLAMNNESESPMERYVCIHGHFYQPPRENPWLEFVELQDSAYPFHDWNERITAECYAPNATSRIFDDDGRIAEIVNNYSQISFNFGPTLLAWLEHAAGDVYAAIQEADRVSQNASPVMDRPSLRPTIT